MSHREWPYYSGYIRLSCRLLVMNGMLLWTLHMLGTNYLSCVIVWFAVCVVVMRLHLWYLTRKCCAVTT